MCKLDCLWLNPYLFVALSKWLITSGSSRFSPTYGDTAGNREELGVKFDGWFPQEYTPVMCRDIAPKFNPELINRQSEPVWVIVCV